jgi:hypothetical protein
VTCSTCRREINRRRLHYVLRTCDVLCPTCVDRDDRYDDVVGLGAAAVVPSIIRFVRDEGVASC